MTYNLYPADPFYQALVNRITDRLKMNRIEVYEANVENAMATTLNKNSANDYGRPVIVYNATFMSQVYAHNPWAAYTVMAHEVGHHYNQDLHGHFLLKHHGVNKRSHRQELNADYLAGWVLHCEGASLYDVLSLADAIDLQESDSHPGESKRRQAMSKGWHDSNCASLPPVQYVPKTTQTYQPGVGEVMVGVGVFALLLLGIGAAVSKK